MIHFDPLIITIWAVVMGVLFTVLLIWIRKSIRMVESHQQDQLSRAGVLRITKMLNRQGIGLPRYLRKARPTAVERHLLACQHCATTEICDAYMERKKQLDEKTFCPNFPEFEKYMRHRIHQ